jgi:hypothetical protein
MPVTGPVSPWAQGIIDPGSCAYPLCDFARRMRSGEPNGAGISVENVAWVGADGMTAPQANSNAFLRACWAARFGGEISPKTNLWHGEFDGRNRCADPGWAGDLEDWAQETARRLLAGDLSGLREVEGGEPEPPPPPPVEDWEGRYRLLAGEVRMWVMHDAAGAKLRSGRLDDLLKGTGL